MMLITKAERPIVLPQEAAADLDMLCRNAREFAWNGQVSAFAYGEVQAQKTWTEVHEHVRECLDDKAKGNGAWHRSLQFVFKHRENAVWHTMQRLLNETFLMSDPGPWGKLQICAFIAQGMTYETIAWRTGQPQRGIHEIYNQFMDFISHLKKDERTDWKTDFGAVEEAYFRFKRTHAHGEFAKEDELWNPRAAMDLPEYQAPPTETEDTK